MSRKSGKPSTRLLRWYDRHARILPWRISPADREAGEIPDPYAVWLSEIMLQQTTVATVTPRYEVFLQRWPTIAHMAAAPLDDILGQWAGLGYYARARNLHKCAIEIVENHDGKFPQTEEALIKLPGIGVYTAAAVAAIAFNQRSIVVDGNIERVVSRLYSIETPLPKSKPEIKKKATELWPKKRSGDFAQGLMDLGAMICVPRKPDCENCPLQVDCAAFASGNATHLPRKAKKLAKPRRYGAAFVLLNKQGEVLFERRPEKGLLGGMMGLPGSSWTEKMLPAIPPEKATWRHVGEARHTFTHFHLLLEVHQGMTNRQPSTGERWINPAEVKLPTVMKKALDLAIKDQGDQTCLFD